MRDLDSSIRRERSTRLMVAHLNRLPKSQPIFCTSTPGTVKNNVDRVDEVQVLRNQRRRRKEGWDEDQFQENTTQTLTEELDRQEQEQQRLRTKRKSGEMRKQKKERSSETQRATKRRLSTEAEPRTLPERQITPARPF